MPQIRPTPRFCRQYRELEENRHLPNRLDGKDIRESLTAALTDEQWTSLSNLAKREATTLSLSINGGNYEILFWREPNRGGRSRGKIYRAKRIISPY